MSTWAGVELGEYSIEEWQNTYHKWLFNDTDRVREVPKDSFIGYRMDTATLRRRLELQGVNRLAVETEMDEVKLSWIKEMKASSDQLCFSACLTICVVCSVRSSGAAVAKNREMAALSLRR